jgi:hypothetical protein
MLQSISQIYSTLSSLIAMFVFLCTKIFYFWLVFRGFTSNFYLVILPNSLVTRHIHSLSASSSKPASYRASVCVCVFFPPAN